MFSGFNALEIFFALCAILGAIFVIARLGTQFLGAHSDVSTDMHSGDIAHDSSDLGFKLLSLHGLAYFFLMFGLVGLAMYRQSRYIAPISVAGAAAAGLASVWAIQRMFIFFKRMQSSGTVSNIGLEGCRGTVYLGIPAGGTGRVTVNHRDRMRELDAVSAHGEVLETGTAVRIVEFRDGIVVVEKLKSVSADS